MKRLLALLFLTVTLACTNSLAARTYLVAVGVTEYADPAITRLPTNANDARAIVEFFNGNEPLSYVQLINDEATEDRILRAMRKVYAQAQTDDKVIFFFSGHGYPGGDNFPAV
ncbi:MAG: caspase family protein [Muribaculaceae bacterium]